MIAKRCPDAFCDENNILRGAKTQGVSQKYEGSYKDASKHEQNQRRWFGVDNRYVEIEKCLVSVLAFDPKKFKKSKIWTIEVRK